jgi:valyl-tRNA synthetase
MNGVGASASIAAPPAELPVNRWIIGEVVETLDKLNRAFDELRFDEMADAIYHFVWGTFCDWYVELIKGEINPATVEPKKGLLLNGVPGAELPQSQHERAAESRRVAAWTFDQILVMLHPLMPFITEELWHAMGERPYDLIVAKWPEPEAQVDAKAKQSIEFLIKLINEIRSARQEAHISPSGILSLAVRWPTLKIWQADILFKAHSDALRRIGRVDITRLVSFPGDPSDEGHPDTSFVIESVGEEIRRGSLTIIADEFEAFAPLEGVIDIEAEKIRIARDLAAAEKERDSLAQRLANPNFTERAKPEAVDKARADHEAKSAEAERLRAALERLG